MIYESINQLGAVTPPDPYGSPEAWASYLSSLRQALQVASSKAVQSYQTLRQVRKDLGLPFMAPGGESQDLGAWTPNLEQEALDVFAMAKVFSDGVSDVLEGKRKLVWRENLQDFAIEGFSSDPLRIEYAPSGAPELVDALGAQTHVPGQIGVAPLVIVAAVGGLSLVTGIAVGVLVYQGLRTIEVVAEQKTQRTLAETAGKNSDLVAQNKATPEQAAKLNQSLYSGAAEWQKAAGESKRDDKGTGDIASAVKTLAWVGLGVGVLYVVAQVIGKMPSMPALTGAKDNPTREDWLRALEEDERALAAVRQSIQKIERGGSVANLTLAGARNVERGLSQAVTNKRKLLAKDNPDYTRFRSSYLPSHMRDVPPLTPSGTDLEIWTWEDERRSPKTGEMVKTYYGIAFAGKAGKPLWHHWFGTAASRLDMIKRSIAGRQAHLKWREERTGARRDFKHTLKVGDTIYTSWGYDQTNVDFYEIVEVKGKSVVVCKIGSKTVESRQNISYVVPSIGTCRGKTSLHRVGEGNSVKIGNHYAHKWEGKPVYETAFGWGH